MPPPGLGLTRQLRPRQRGFALRTPIFPLALASTLSRPFRVLGKEMVLFSYCLADGAAHDAADRRDASNVVFATNRRLPYGLQRQESSIKLSRERQADSSPLAPSLRLSRQGRSPFAVPHA